MFSFAITVTARLVWPPGSSPVVVGWEGVVETKGAFRFMKACKGWLLEWPVFLTDRVIMVVPWGLIWVLGSPE